MKLWTIRKRIASGFVPALIALAGAARKAVVGALAKWIGGLARHSGPLPLPANGEPSLPAVDFGEISGDGRDLPRSTPRKPVRQAALAVKDGFKEF